MKRIAALIIALMLVLVQFGAIAEMGVQIIGGPETETEPVSLDDIKLDATVDIDGYGEITPTSFRTVDELLSYRAGTKYIQDEANYWDDYCVYYSSGVEADYCLLNMDILNTQMRAVDFIDGCTVVVTSDDSYQFAGWAYQYNYNNENYSNHNSGCGIDDANTTCVIDPSDNFPIDPMYIGHYVFGCTLPNRVISAKTPLKMVITIGGNEITYNIRK